MSYFSKQPSDSDGSLLVPETLILELTTHRGHMTPGGRHSPFQPIDPRDTAVMELREGGEEALHTGPDMGGGGRKPSVTQRTEKQDVDVLVLPGRQLP